MFYAKYNSATGRLSFANAGHNHPLVKRGNETACLDLDAEGLILGVKKSVVFEERGIELLRGDVVFFYTDGLNEATNSDGEMFGTERICTLLEHVGHLPVKEIIDSFYKSVTDFIGSDTLQDDVSVVVLKIL
jgi:sigma-B regulation protein RsbU (phosphoserine phosphatase)